MPRTSIGLLLALVLAATAGAQNPFPVGTRSVAWSNTTGVGSLRLDATVHYPAVSAGVNAPVLPRAGGWPVIVFLHGYAWLGSSYAALGDAWARAGYVVVLSDTCQYDYVTQEFDGRALHTAITVENGLAGSPFAGAFDVDRMVLAGHSMGGGNVGNVLANNPGYRCGLALSPILPQGTNAAHIEVPFGIVVGAGDTLTPWNWLAQPYYNAVTGHGSIKFLYLLDGTCDHMNLVGLPTPAVPAIFDRTVSVGLGFFGHCLQTDTTGLDKVMGPAALAEPRLLSLQREAAVPQMWLESDLRVGTTTRASLTEDGGSSCVIAAMNLVPGLPTPYGVMLVEPTSAFVVDWAVSNSTGRTDLAITVPPNAALVGLPVALQGFGSAASAWLTFGNAAMVSVKP